MMKNLLYPSRHFIIAFWTLGLMGIITGCLDMRISFEPKNPEIEDHDLFPSLQQLAGQAFAWTLVRRLIVDQDVTEMHWASDEWKNFRLS